MQGAVQVRARYTGAVTRVVLQVRQVFHRISAPSAADVAEARFDFFCKHLLPQVANSTDSAANQAHTLVFVPSYFDYVRIRNILTDKEASYSACCEYARVFTAPCGRLFPPIFLTPCACTHRVG